MPTTNLLTKWLRNARTQRQWNGARLSYGKLNRVDLEDEQDTIKYMNKS